MAVTNRIRDTQIRPEEGFSPVSKVRAKHDIEAGEARYRCMIVHAYPVLRIHREVVQ